MAEEVHGDPERGAILDAPAALAYGLVDRIAPGRRSMPGAQEI
ncbi:hypothetical protein [Streptomyces sp. NPDC007205]